jgi:hypothetical protein
LFDVHHLQKTLEKSLPFRPDSLDAFHTLRFAQANNPLG